MQTKGSELDALEKTCEAILKHALKMKYEIITVDSSVRSYISLASTLSMPYINICRLIVAIT